MVANPVKRRLVLNGLLGAGIVIVAVLLGWPSSEETARTLTGELAKKQVVTIRIERRRGKTIALEKQNGRWRVTEPVSGEADDSRVSYILNVLSTRSHASYPLQDGNRAQFGLAPPLATLYLNETLEIRFGDTDPLEQRRYVQTGGAIHLIDDTILPLLTGEPETFVDKKAADGESS